MRAKGAARKRATPGGLAKAAIAALLGLYAAWWVVKVGVVQAEGEDNPFLAARVAPDHPRVQIGLAMTYFLLQGGNVPDERRRAALDALKRAPLADEPYLLAGVNALAAGRNADGERLLAEARRRNPRLRLARLLLLDRYLRERRAPQAVAEMQALGNLVEGASGVLTPELARMVQDPVTAPQLIPLLRAQPALHQTVLETLVASGADEHLILQVAGPASRPALAGPWKAALLSRLISHHEIGRAWELWKSFAGTGAGGIDGGKGLYDPAFAGLPGPPPFNWTFSSGTVGAAERNANHALQVDYYGRDNGNLASQLLMLRPGRYRLSFRATGDATGEGSRIVWNIACEPGEARLLQLPITGVSSASKRFAAAFTVPAGGCPAQWLRLDGLSGDVENGQSVIISGLSIEPEGGA
ncbi:MAG: hypothetical protein QOH81_794 [Sphingomonadales bacterium]|nr:hypothetical protein [Sphingomonadales bacterium]